MTIQFPQYAWFLLSAGLLAGGLLWYHMWWKKAKAKLGQWRHFTYLGAALRFRNSPGNVLALILSSVLLSIALLNPRTPEAGDGKSNVQGLDIALALDVSNSMLAADMPPSRLQQATLLMQRLLDTLRNNRISFTAFAGDAYLQMPMTTDLQGARTIIESVSTKMVPVQGTSIERALTVAGNSFDAAPSNHKALILITDGETHDEQSLKTAAELRNSGVMIIAIGIGSPQGVALKDENGFAIRDPETNEQVISALNQPLLQQLAEATSGEYHFFNESTSVLSAILSDLNGMDKKPIANLSRINYNSYAFVFLGLALLLLALAPFLKTMAQAKSKTIITTILLLTMQLVVAQETNINKAREQYQQGKLDAATQLMKQVLQKFPDNEVANFYLGNLAFKNGNYEEAASYFDKSRQYLQKNELKAKAANNEGVALANSNKVTEAIDILKEALRRSPYDEDIQHNLNVALQKQKQQPPPQQQPPPPPKQKQKNEDKLKALDQEEKKIRDQQMQKRQSGGTGRNW